MPYHYMKMRASKQLLTFKRTSKQLLCFIYIFVPILCFFQLHAAISHQVDPECLGLGLGSMLLNSLKQTVVTLASNAGVLNTVQSAAQAVLQSGWSVLLPTAEERARALSALLPNAGMLHCALGFYIFVCY